MIVWGPIVLIATFFAMEFMAWATHKFVMHGLMWYFHKDHHQEEPGFFERNDVFFMIYVVLICFYTFYKSFRVLKCFYKFQI